MLQGAIIGAVVGGLVAIIMMFFQKRMDCPGCKKPIGYFGSKPPEKCPLCKADIDGTYDDRDDRPIRRDPQP